MSTVVAKGPAITRDEKLEELIDKYQISLLKVCFTFLHDRSLAEDAVQETFIKVYQGLDSFHGNSSEKTWIFRIAMNTCRDMLRTRWFRFVDRRVDLSQLPELNPSMGLMVRQLVAASDGIPLQIYAFTRTKVWAEYEDIQSRLVEYALASLHEYNLVVFQRGGLPPEVEEK